MLARLGARVELEFPALRPHQEHPWHAFLVQLGALVAARSGDPRLDRSADAWRNALLNLAQPKEDESHEGDRLDAWSLVVEDVARPAFLQMPVPDGQWGRYKVSAQTPDDLDLLVTAKNHDVKQHLMVSARPEHWAYALIALQTFQGYSGRGKHGVARMNSGFGNRPGFAAAPGLGWAQRFARDVVVWLEQRSTLLGLGYEMAEEGPSLLWTLAWDGVRPRLAFQYCDPFFLEVCRRARLRPGEEGQVMAWTAPSDSTFLDAKERLGDTGDVWTPVAATEGTVKALTLSAEGLSYRRLQDVLFSPKWSHCPALEVRLEDGDEPVVIAQALVRGQGKTEGYHQRLLPFPKKVAGYLRCADGRARLARLAKERVSKAAEVGRRVLEPALCALLQGGSESLDFKDKRPSRWLERMDREVDAVFFDHLWRDLPAEGDSPDDGFGQVDAQNRWEETLYDLAKEQLLAATHEASVPHARRIRARAVAELRFEAAARKVLQARQALQNRQTGTLGNDPGADHA